jgi:hypothetical protein
MQLSYRSGVSLFPTDIVNSTLHPFFVTIGTSLNKVFNMPYTVLITMEFRKQNSV